LAKPVPRLLPPSFHLFTDYPYLLPAILVALITAAAATTAVLYLTETLLKGHQQSAKSSSSGLKELLTYKPFQTVVMVYSINNGVMFSWEAIYPLFAFTSVELGGLGLEVRLSVY